MKTSFEIRSKIAELSTEYRSLFAALTAENKTETETRAADIMSEIDGLEARAANFEKLETAEAQAATRAKSRKPVIADVEFDAASDSDEGDDDYAAYRSFLRGDKRALTLGANPGLAPTAVRNDIITAAADFSAMMRVAKVIRTSDGSTMNFNYTDDTSNEGYLVSEVADRSSSNAAVIATKALTSFEVTSGTLPVSNKIIRDSTPDPIAYVNGLLVSRIGRKVNRLATVGTGHANDQPEGLIYAANVAVVTAASNAITDAEIFKLQQSIDSSYRENAKFMLNDSTLLYLRGLKDTTGRSLLVDGLNSGVPTTLAGQPVIVNNHMEGVTANAVAIAYGDFAEAYTLRIVEDVTVLSFNDSKYAEVGQTGFNAQLSVDGALVNAAAVKTLKLKA